MLPLLKGCFSYVLPWGVLTIRSWQNGKEKTASADKDDMVASDEQKEKGGYGRTPGPEARSEGQVEPP